MLSSVTIDTLQILGSGVSTYLMANLDGLDFPDVRVSSYDKPGENASVMANELYGSRTLNFSGAVTGTDVPTYRAARQALAYACRIQRDSHGLVSPTTISLTTLDGGTYTLTGYIQPPFRCSSPYPTWAPFQFTFLAVDPAIYATGTVTSGQISRQAAGGATFPWTFPVIFGSGSGGSGDVVNAGNMDTWPVIYLRGTMTSPRLYSVTRQATMQLNYTTSNITDVIVIDMANKTIMLNGVTNLLQNRTSDSTWFSLTPGDNAFLFTTGSSGDTGTAEITASSAYLAI